MRGLNIRKRLFNVEFDRDPDHLSNEPPLEGLHIRQSGEDDQGSR